MAHFTWTDHALDTARKMSEEGKSATQIAAALSSPRGVVTRNAVLGKLFRLRGGKRVGIVNHGRLRLFVPVEQRRYEKGFQCFVSDDRAHFWIWHRGNLPKALTAAQDMPGIKKFTWDYIELPKEMKS